MPANPAVHPEPCVLQAFALGKLSDPETDAVSRHLETCNRCRQQVKDVKPDSFLDKVQAAQPGAVATQLPRALPSRPAGGPSLPGGTLAQTADPPLAPAELANHPKFRLVKEVGRGGMGVVYLAEHRVMERTVAIKVISQDIINHPDALARFHAEVKAAARLNHPNIVQAFDAESVRVTQRDGEATASLPGSLHMLVMEFVEGVSLADYLERKGPLPVGLACHFARQAALGLQHAFEKGMVHRDIKPKNLMVTQKGQVKILDFGLARLASERGREGRLTRMGDFMGTPEFVAPEQATDARAADIRADLYSLGCTLYCLLAGRPPFQDDTAVKVIFAHLEKEPTPLPQLRQDVPEALWAVIARLLAKDRAQRYQTPTEVAEQLRPFARVGPKAGPVAVPPWPSPAAVSPGRATMTATDTSNLPARPPVADPPPPPGVPPASPFEGLDAAVQPPEKPKPTTKPRPPRRSKRWVLVGGAAAACAGVVVIAGIVIWVNVKSDKDKTEATVKITVEGERGEKSPPTPAPDKPVPVPPTSGGDKPVPPGANDIEKQLEEKIFPSLVHVKAAGDGRMPLGVVTDSGVCTVMPGSFQDVELVTLDGKRTFAGRVRTRSPFPFCWIDSPALNLPRAKYVKNGAARKPQDAFIVVRRGGAAKIVAGKVEASGAFSTAVEVSPNQKGVVAPGPIFAADGTCLGLSLRSDRDQPIVIYQLN